MKNAIKRAGHAVLAATLMAACGQKTPPPDYDSIAEAAVNHPDRRSEDAANDQRRKAAQSLAFFQIEPGMTVVEMEAGGGYYTELLSLAVGSDGKVITQNPEGFIPYFADELKARDIEVRLPNVLQTYSIFDELDAEDGSVDLVTWVQGPHELYFTPEDGTELGDPADVYAEIFRIVKPGGAFVAIDHSAVAGAPESTGNDLHRIDKAIVIEAAQAAGFELEAEGDFLANPDDDRTKLVFDPSIRGHTDQFALRLRKP